MTVWGIVALVVGTILALSGASGPANEPGVWVALIGGLVLMTAGVVLRRVGSRRAARARGMGGGSDRSLQAVESITVAVEKLETECGSLAGYELRDAVRAALDPSRDEFYDASQSLLDGFGILLWSEVVGNFARGERWLHRAESASTDGADEEARAAVVRALPWFYDCARRLREAAGESMS